jgi:ubiquitin-protein ligase
MEDIEKLIDILNFDDIIINQTKVYFVESVIKKTTSDVNKNVTSNTVNMLWNEVCKINNSNNVLVEPVDNNLLKLLVKVYPSSDRLITEFKNKQYHGEIVIKIKIPFDYPYSPHQITIKYPIFENNINYNIKACDYFKTNIWNPTNTIEYTIQNIQNIIETYGTLYNNKKYETLNNFLEKLSIVSNIPPLKYEPFTIHNIPIKKITNNNNWTAGTGYGSRNSSKWNINDYLLIEKKKNDRIIKYLKILLTIEIDNDIILNSCLIKYLKEILLGIQIFNVLENNNKFLVIFQVIKRFDFIIDDELLTILHNLKLEFKKYIEALEKNNDNLEIYKVNELYNYLIHYHKEIEDVDIQSFNDEYISSLKKLQLDSYPIHEKKLINTKPQILHIKRILQEIQGLSKSLPLDKDSSIFVRYDEENIGLFRFIITGPKDTPYENGCFLFEMILNNDYPNSPPQVHILTTGHGKVRFNPNLYSCGKVCLSLLGTWSGNGGENWNAKTSTLLQVLVSIQSLIFIDKPYFNEPGYETLINTELGNSDSDKYNEKVKVNTHKWAISDMLKNPPEDFKEVIEKHFELKKIGI